MSDGVWKLEVGGLFTVISRKRPVDNVNTIKIAIAIIIIVIICIFIESKMHVWKQVPNVTGRIFVVGGRETTILGRVICNGTETTQRHVTVR